MVNITPNVAPLIYLDTADYSRFGDVERGVGDQKASKIYERLLALKTTGAARFAYSMPILSELLQYNPNFEETCRAKARAVERLCGKTAFISMERMIAIDASLLCKELGLDIPLTESAISERSEWFARVDGAFTDLKIKFSTAINKQVSDFSIGRNRAQRKMINAQVRRLSLSTLADAAAPDLAEEWGLRAADVRESIVAVLDNRITADSAALRLFQAIAEPTAFIRAYFVKNTGDKSLPLFFRQPGLAVQAILAKMRMDIMALSVNKSKKEDFWRLYPAHVNSLGRVLFDRSIGEFERSGVPLSIVEPLMTDPGGVVSLPSCNAIVRMSFALAAQAASLSGHEPERSAVGDVFHTMYLPHCDLWRSDKRHAALVKKELPQFADRIVARLADLPDRIDCFA